MLVGWRENCGIINLAEQVLYPTPFVLALNFWDIEGMSFSHVIPNFVFFFLSQHLYKG